tara:strand:- start:4518 stop:5090 length:573 start_codon:yes stop_codon:yes gene_type:complete
MLELLYGFIYWQFVALVGVRYGYHRYWSHNEFEAPIFYEWISLFFGLFSGARSPLGWIGAHRMHHDFSDTDKDPHSPTHKGFYTVLFSLWTVKHIPRKYIKSIIQNQRIQFFHKYWKIIWFGSAVFLLLCGLKYFLIFWFYPFLFGQIGFGLLNTLGHKNGKPSNSLLAAFFTVGEGLHKKHHDYDISAN